MTAATPAEPGKEHEEQGISGSQRKTRGFWRKLRDLTVFHHQKEDEKETEKWESYKEADAVSDTDEG